MPPKRTTAQKHLKPSVTGNFSYNGAPFTFPGPPCDEVQLTAQDIVNHIRICPNVTLSRTRKLINAALQAKCLDVTIGLPPPKASVQTAANPTYYYEGNNIMELEPMLVNKRTMLECTATLCWGDGGQAIDDDGDVEHEIQVIQDNYREPSLSIFFELDVSL